MLYYKHKNYVKQACRQVDDATKLWLDEDVPSEMLGRSLPTSIIARLFWALGWIHGWTLTGFLARIVRVPACRALILFYKKKHLTCHCVV